uniref:Uncharacterized protein n=1 Tax=Arion vulgaris TaxID=1028688 RepID=A0A0B7AGV9_9EUPU
MIFIDVNDKGVRDGRNLIDGDSLSGLSDGNGEEVCVMLADIAVNLCKSCFCDGFYNSLFLHDYNTIC